MPEKHDESPDSQSSMISSSEAVQAFELIGTGELELPVFEDMDDNSKWETPNPNVEPGWGQGFNFRTEGRADQFTLELEVDGIVSAYGCRLVPAEDGGWVQEDGGPTALRNMIETIDSVSCGCGRIVGGEPFECGRGSHWEPYRWDRWRKDVDYMLDFYGVSWDPTIIF